MCAGGREQNDSASGGYRDPKRSLLRRRSSSILQPHRSPALSRQRLRTLLLEVIEDIALSLDGSVCLPRRRLPRLRRRRPGTRNGPGHLRPRNIKSAFVPPLSALHSGRPLQSTQPIVCALGRVC